MIRRFDYKMITTFQSLVLLILMVCCMTTHAYIIEPGVGLIQQIPISSKSRQSPSPLLPPIEVVIFEHTDIAGTGGLVLNCPTPLQLGNIAIPRFHAFEKLPLMLGCDDNNNNNKDDDDDALSSASCLPLGSLSPWFWLHDMENLSGSFALQGAAGPLYMGGNLEEATQRIQEENIDPAGHFKFFRKYKSWTAGQLEQEIEQGLWKVIPQDPTKALEAVRSSVPPLSSSS